MAITDGGNDIALEFLTVLYAIKSPAAKKLTLLTINRASTDPRTAQSTEWADTEAELVDKARRHNLECVWFGVAPRTHRPKTGRGRAADCAEITALYADIDFDSPNHAPYNPKHKPRDPLPADLDAALDLINDYPIRPSMIVATGGGLQPWWLLDQPVPGLEAGAILAEFGATWAELGRRRAVHVDNVFDLARIMRLPGTLNTKSDPPVPVTILPGATYTRHRLEDLRAGMIRPPAELEAAQSISVAQAEKRLERPARAEVPYIGPERPGDAFNAAIDPADLLLAAGWQYHSVDSRTGERQYTRPGKEVGQGSSATVYPDNHVIVWSDATDLEPRRHYDAFGLYAALNHNNDHARARLELNRAGYGARRVDTLELDAALIAGRIAPASTSSTGSPGNPLKADEILEQSSWRPLDNLAQHADAPAIVPRWLTRVDGKQLLYAGLTNGLFGESGSGKSWVALAACAEALTTGRTVLYIDLEDHPRSIVGRLRALGAGDHIDRFEYVRPDMPAGLTDLEYLDGLIVKAGAEILVIDSVGEAMALQGLKQNDDDDVARWYRTFARRWASLGPAVILVDHIPKNTENSKLAPIGSQRKKAATDGVMYLVTQVKALGRGQHGILTLTTAKDRNGTYGNDQVAAQIHFRSADDDGTAMAVEVALPEARTADGQVARPTVLMQRISRELEHGSALGRQELINRVKGNTAAKRRAVELLLEEGYLSTHTQAGTQTVFLSSIRPYTNDSVPAGFGPDMSSQPTTATTATNGDLSATSRRSVVPKAAGDHGDPTPVGGRPRSPVAATDDPQPTNPGDRRPNLTDDLF